MTRNRPRYTAACNFRVLLQAHESGKTIRRRPDNCTPAQERFLLCGRQTARCRSEPAAFV